MDALAVDFLAWAGDAGRSVEEKFGVVLLVENVYLRFCWAAGLPMVNYEERRKLREARKYNPAYAAEVPRWKLEFAAGKLGEVREALDEAGFLKLQGVRFGEAMPGCFQIFGQPPTPWTRRTMMMNFLKTETIARAREIVECLRRALAGFRHRWQIHVLMEVEPDADRWDESWKNESAETRARREKEEVRYHEFQQKRKRILLDDELRLRMMKELGEDLSGFKPSPRPARPDDPHDAPEPEEEEQDDDGPGGAAECDPDKEAKDEHWLPPVKITDPNSVWRNLNCMFVFDEEAIYVHVKNHGLEHIRDLFDLP